MKPTSLEELKEVVKEEARLITRGGGSKSGLSRIVDGLTILDLSGLAGIIEYDPSEYTFTALAGTRVDEVETALYEHGQYLPFDPVLIEQGATLGGTVASGLSGPGRYQYGGVRDFLLGVKFVNGEGEMIQGGGKVVKNAAGFDLPKLMVGSLGQFGALVELSFKVFPRPDAFVTIASEYQTIAESLSFLYRITGASMDVYAIDLVPGPESITLFVRLGGVEKSFQDRVVRVREILNGGKLIPEEEESQFWRTAREFGWVPKGNSLVKVPITPKHVAELDARLLVDKATRWYSVGANVAWIAWPGEVEDLNNLLTSLHLSGMVVLGTAKSPLLGKRMGQTFAKRIKKALDPSGRWVEV